MGWARVPTIKLWWITIIMKMEALSILSFCKIDNHSHKCQIKKFHNSRTTAGTVKQRRSARSCTPTAAALAMWTAPSGTLRLEATSALQRCAAEVCSPQQRCAAGCPAGRYCSTTREASPISSLQTWPARWTCRGYHSRCQRKRMACCCGWAGASLLNWRGRSMLTTPLRLLSRSTMLMARVCSMRSPSRLIRVPSRPPARCLRIGTFASSKRELARRLSVHRTANGWIESIYLRILVNLSGHLIS